MHVPALFEELDALVTKGGSNSFLRIFRLVQLNRDSFPSAGLNCDGRLFISDRAHLVFDFHQIVDGLKEVELGGKSLGTTKRGIGPAYSSKASRSGLRVHHLIYDFAHFEAKFRTLVEGRFKRYGHFEYDTEQEILRYKVRDGFTNFHFSQFLLTRPLLFSAGTRGSSQALRRRWCGLHSPSPLVEKASPM